MQRYLDTMTTTKTANKISVGLVVATGILVVASVAAAAIYTLMTNSVSGGATEITTKASTPTSAVDRTIAIPAQ
jgi:hypothetical protein